LALVDICQHVLLNIEQRKKVWSDNRKSVFLGLQFFSIIVLTIPAFMPDSSLSPDLLHPSTPLAVIILAAGKGTRMNNPDKAKVMFELAGVPMIDYVIQQAMSLTPSLVIAIVGFQKASVMEYLRARFGEAVGFAHQDKQLGTGHAVQQAEQQMIGFEGDVLILSGDVPLLQTATLQAFAEAHQRSAAAVSVLSVDAPNPAGYGRIVRGKAGEFERIVEHKDASDDERAVTEINSGIYLVNATKLFSALHQVSNSNVQGEYYLTDIISILRGRGERVAAWKCDAFGEVLGVNTVQQLEEAQIMLEMLQQEANRTLTHTIMGFAEV
jgi:UDP-N-acetylglucosamine pyrophosphorylase